MANSIDLSGKLIIKAKLGDDIRRIPIHNEDITYDELVLMMQRVFRGMIHTTDDLVIKYKDEDNDLITIFDSSDLSFAIQCSRILKITLFVNGSLSTPSSVQLPQVCAELRSIRDRVTQLLDELTAPSHTVEETPRADKPEKKDRGDPPVVAKPAALSSAAGSKEFDPLTEKQQQNSVMASFGLNHHDASLAAHPGSPQHHRAGTPDSVSSLGSTAPAKPGPPQAAAAQYAMQPSAHTASPYGPQSTQHPGPAATQYVSQASQVSTPQYAGQSAVQLPSQYSGPSAAPQPSAQYPSQSPVHHQGPGTASQQYPGQQPQQPAVQAAGQSRGPPASQSQVGAAMGQGADGSQQYAPQQYPYNTATTGGAAYPYSSGQWPQGAYAQQYQGGYTQQSGQQNAAQPVAQLAPGTAPQHQPNTVAQQQPAGNAQAAASTGQQQYYGGAQTHPAGAYPRAKYPTPQGQYPQFQPRAQ